MYTEVLVKRRERFVGEAVIGLYDVIEKQLYEFDDLTLDGKRKRLLTIGRARNCDIKPQDSTVSMVHCTIYRQPDGTFLIEDSASTNGLLANEIKVERVVLVPGMWLFVGRAELVAIGADRKIPIKATTHSSFLARAAHVYGSDRKAAGFINKSRESIRRARQKKQIGSEE